MQRLTASFLTVLLLFSAIPGFAQQNMPLINPGDAITAELVAPEADYYRLTVTEDSPAELLITLESDAFDTLLEIADSSAVTLTSADGGGAGTNVWLVWQPPAAGDYLLIVKSADGAGSGAYTLGISAYAPPPEDTTFSIAIGETVSAQFPGVDAGDYIPDKVWFVFTAEQGDVLDFAVETTNTVLNSAIVLYTQSDYQLEYSGSRVNPELRQVVFSESGTFSVGVSYLAHTANDQPVGAFSLTISRGEPLPELTAAPQTAVIPPARAQGFTSSIRYVFDIEAGSTYRIQLRIIHVEGGDSYDLFLDVRFGTRRGLLCNEHIGSGPVVDSATELTCEFTAEYSGTAITHIDNFSYPEALTVEFRVETIP